MSNVTAAIFGDGQPANDAAVDILRRSRSRELFFAVVGPVGAGGSRVISSLTRVGEEAGYKCETIKASQLIRQWATDKNLSNNLPLEKTLTVVERLQDLGDEIRSRDPAAVARQVMREIARKRADARNVKYVQGEAVLPDDAKRIYLIDSIRHPAEVNLLRRTYGNSFALVAVVCEEKERTERILGKYFTKPEALKDDNIARVNEFVKRDADDITRKHGQHVTEAFYEADFFIDNTAQDSEDKQRLLDDMCGRLVDIISHSKVVRPSIEETAMHHAHSARVRSACMSRQVGAALLDGDGTVVATGANEVPAAGGGVYGEVGGASNRLHDERCVFRATKYCSSNREQNRIIEELISAIPQLAAVVDRKQLAADLRRTSVGGLIEFSRAVHAEMDALLSAGREGVSTVGTRLFVTTFPCHYCARHIVSAGVYEVQYIEPYPKSLATSLHSDAIEIDESKWSPPDRQSMAEERKSRRTEDATPGKVLFKPFVGVAPRLYLRAFEKTWRLKDKETGEFKMEPPEWGDEWSSLTLGYPELEAVLTK
ncbi:deoxycytidylate deaminase [Rhizobium leguminosarum]|uniref:anti-phage dCTP deaminase n=1 Tax=Rhizobium TaxID=379 RepID=UPI0013B5CCB7|nr:MULTISPECIES: anti-phage dCTP deaminase [Rhizobium]MBB4339889.1 deoxycytidylate deaminase [Rhizobium leguminosarum]MBB6292891.1 deoxycytidylate deaminase [Rhizobium leguminosarum]NEI16034.1 deoxycytidylate deaminase [Rhizobium ruizarguesonis]NEK46651.1 deoxycytidylate deaminase [Rhizobium leguminosarum]